MNYYPFHIGDYKSHTLHLSPMEDICYRRLMDYYYLHEKKIPNDIEKLCRVLMLNGCSTDVQRVLLEFFELVENEWYHHRIEEEISHANDKKRKASDAGKASARARSEQTFNGRSTDGDKTFNSQSQSQSHNNSNLTSFDYLSDEPKKQKSKKPKDETPYIEIQNLYNEICISLPECTELSDKRKKLIRNCWESKPNRSDLDWWKKFFAAVEASDFLTGRSGAWKVTGFEWLVAETNFLKIIEGGYKNNGGGK